MRRRDSNSRPSGRSHALYPAGVVVLGGNWNYKVQISVKMVRVPGDSKANPSAPDMVQKNRVQVAGEVSNTFRGALRSFFRGYDQVLLQNLFQDLQSKLGTR